MAFETYHKKYSLIETEAGKVFNGVVLKFKPNQPIPVPLNTVQDINVLFDYDQPSNEQLMKIEWIKPKVNVQLGCLAWQDWSYEVTINDQKIVTNDTIHIVKGVPFSEVLDISIQPFSAKGLGPTKDYQIKSWPQELSDMKIAFLKSQGIEIRQISGLVSESLHNFNLEGPFGLEKMGTYFLVNNGSLIQTSTGKSYFDGGQYIESVQHEPLTNVTYINVPNYKMLIKFDGLKSHIFNIPRANFTPKIHDKTSSRGSTY